MSALSLAPAAGLPASPLAIEVLGLESQAPVSVPGECPWGGPQSSDPHPAISNRPGWPQPVPRPRVLEKFPRSSLPLVQLEFVPNA